MKKITLYTTPTCVYCRMAKSFFGVRGVAYEEKDVSRDMAAREEMIKKSGAKVVPVIEIEDELLVGYHRERLREIFKEV
jgi:glutaredoxin-like YruB-family protein